MYLIKRYICILFLYFFLIFLLIFDLVFTKYPYTHTFFVKPNQTLNQITTNLYKEKIIDNKFFFKFLIYSSLSQKILKAGEYEFYNNNIFQIIRKIRVGDAYQRRITIPEGLTSNEIINIIKKTEGIVLNQEGSEQIAEEGALFPSTYFYVYGTNSNIIINNMKKRMKSTLIETWQGRDKDLDLNYNDVLILASIIEKETSLNSEKSKIAQVFLNRLRINMKLQSDPTVIYGIESELGIKKKELTRNDLQHESSFNTYLIYGLPEGPICNPGKESITAVTNPSKGDLLFFVADGEGGHNFSSSYEEHIENVKKFKELRRELYEN